MSEKIDSKWNRSRSRISTAQTFSLQCSMVRKMEMKLMKLFALFLVSLITACSDCSFDIASDQLNLADTLEKNNTTYYLYTRTSGWQEKVVYFELYEQEPVYDKCNNKTTPEPIFGIHYDYFPNDPNSEEKYVQEIALQPNQAEKLKITYTKIKDEGFANVYDVKFSR